MRTRRGGVSRFARLLPIQRGEQRGAGHLAVGGFGHRVPLLRAFLRLLPRGSTPGQRRAIGCERRPYGLPVRGGGSGIREVLPGAGPRRRTLRFRPSRVLGDRLGRDGHRRPDADDVLAAVQRDPEAVPGGQAPDDEEPHAAGGRHVRGARLTDPLVGLEDLGLVHADALVEDFDGEAAVVPRGTDHGHRGLRRRERGRVVEKLGDEPDEVPGGVADDAERRGRADAHTLVLLDLGHGGAQHVRHAHRLSGPAAGLGAGQHHQVLVVAPHAGRQVIQLEQRRQLVGVLLVALKTLDQLKLALHEALAAARQVHEHARVAGAQPRLLGGQPQRLLVHRVEGPGHLPHFVAGVHGNRGDLALDRVAVLDTAHRLGKITVGDVEGAAPQHAQ